MVCWLLGGCAAIVVWAGAAGFPVDLSTRASAQGERPGCGEPRSPFCGGSSPVGLLLAGQVTPCSRVSPREQRTQPGNASLGVYGKGRNLLQPHTCICILSEPPGCGHTHTLPVGTARGVPGTPQHRPAPAAAVPSPVLGWTSGFVLSACCTCCQRGPGSARLSRAPAVVLLLLDVGTHVGVMWRCGVCAQELPPCPPNGSGDRRVCQLHPAGPWAPGSWWQGGVPPSAVGQPGLHRERPMGVGCFTSPHLGSGCREGLTKRL